MTFYGHGGVEARYVSEGCLTVLAEIVPDVGLAGLASGPCPPIYGRVAEDRRKDVVSWRIRHPLL